MKMTVLYYSKTGNTKQMAEIIVQGMASVEGIEAKPFPVDQIDEEWIKESSCVVLGTPTYYADVSGTTKVFLENCKKYGLAGKLGGAFSTADYVHGGGEIAIQTILIHMLVLGMLVFSGGGSYGAPVIHLGPVAIKDNPEAYRETFYLYGQRMAKKTVEIFA